MRRAVLAAAFVLLAGVAAAAPAPSRSDGTVTGTLTLNGKPFKLTHIYARKREAWPADAKLLRVEADDSLSCGIVDLLLTNVALREATIAAILQGDYRGSDTIRGVRFVIDGSGTYKWASSFLLESGSVEPFGITQSSGSITSGRRYTGKVSCRNEDVTQVRTFDVSFDTPVKLQYSRTETETAEPVPPTRFAEEFRQAMPGQWRIERWLGLGCTTATGTLDVSERTSPHTFRGTLHIHTSKGDDIEEEVTLSPSGTKVHLEGGAVSVPESVWGSRRARSRALEGPAGRQQRHGLSRAAQGRPGRCHSSLRLLG